MNLEFVRRMHTGFAVAVGVQQLSPCFCFEDSGGIDARYRGYPKTDDFPNPWHIGTLDAATYPNPHELLQGELELLAHMFTMVVELKPKLVFESGCNVGLMTRALAAGCWVNGFGHVVSCDIDERMVKYATEVCSGLPVDIQLCAALSMDELKHADLLFIDSDEKSRVQEIGLIKTGAVYVLHDTCAERWMREFCDGDDVVHVDGPRGFTIGRRK